MRCWPGARCMEAAAGMGSGMALVVHSSHLGMAGSSVPAVRGWVRAAVLCAHSSASSESLAEMAAQFTILIKNHIRFPRFGFSK